MKPFCVKNRKISDFYEYIQNKQMKECSYLVVWKEVRKLFTVVRIQIN